MPGHLVLGHRVRAAGLLAPGLIQDGHDLAAEKNLGLRLQLFVVILPAQTEAIVIAKDVAKDTEEDRVVV